MGKMLDKLTEYLDNATQEELQETYNELSHLLCKGNSTIVERAVNAQREVTPNKDWGDVSYGYQRGATEQKAIDDKELTIHTINCLERQRKAIADRVCKALDGIYFANEDMRTEAKDVLRKVIERKRKEK